MVAHSGRGSTPQVSLQPWMAAAVSNGSDQNLHHQQQGAVESSYRAGQKQRMQCYCMQNLLAACWLPSHVALAVFAKGLELFGAVLHTNKIGHIV